MNEKEFNALNESAEEICEYTANELAALLGKTLRSDDRYVALEAAHAAYEKAPQLHTCMTEYNVQQHAYEAECAKETPDTLLIASIERRIEELYNMITSDPVFAALNKAQEDFNALMEEINGTLMYNLTGQMPCTHDCSSCGGGCEHHHHH